MSLHECLLCNIISLHRRTQRDRRDTNRITLVAVDETTERGQLTRPSELDQLSIS